MSKVVCLAPWVHLHAIGEARGLCCVTKKTLTFQTQEEFWNGPYMTEVRRDFMAGVERKECSDCFGATPSQDEDRRYYQHFEQEFGHLEDAALAVTNPEGETSFKPVSFDMRQRLCNMTCKTCGTGSSSAHALASNRSTGKKVFHIENFKDSMEQHTEDILNLVSERTEEIYWAGGEPLMSPVYWATMERMVEKGWTQCVMRYNTNGTKLAEDTPVAEKAMEYFRTFENKVFLSLDGIGVVNEYIRSGSKWADMDKVLRRLVKEVRGLVAVDMTGTNLGVLQLPDIVRYLEDTGVQHFHIKGLVVSHHMTMKGGEMHNANSYLSVKLLKPETIQRIINEVTALPVSFRFRWEALKFLEFIKPHVTGRNLTLIEQKSIRDAERRFADTMSIIPILKKQRL